MPSKKVLDRQRRGGKSEVDAKKEKAKAKRKRKRQPKLFSANEHHLLLGFIENFTDSLEHSLPATAHSSIRKAIQPEIEMFATAKVGDQPIMDREGSIKKHEVLSELADMLAESVSNYTRAAFKEALGRQLVEKLGLGPVVVAKNDDDD